MSKLCQPQVSSTTNNSEERHSPRRKNIYTVATPTRPQQATADSESRSSLTGPPSYNDERPNGRVIPLHRYSRAGVPRSRSSRDPTVQAYTHAGRRLQSLASPRVSNMAYEPAAARTKRQSRAGARSGDTHGLNWHKSRLPHSSTTIMPSHPVRVPPQRPSRLLSHW